MKIKIDKFWQNTKGQQVLPGEHESSDLPNGIAQYLVDNGHAIVIEADAPVKRVRADKTVIPSDIASEPDTSEFDRLSAEYEALSGNAPAWNIKLETLRQRVAELKAENSEG